MTRDLRKHLTSERPKQLEKGNTETNNVGSSGKKKTIIIFREIRKGIITSITCIKNI